MNIFTGSLRFFPCLLYAASLFSLTACAPQPRVVTLAPPLCPAKPSLPRVPSASLQCLDDKTYRDLVERDLRLQEYITLLETNCER